MINWLTDDDRMFPADKAIDTGTVYHLTIDLDDDETCDHSHLNWTVYNGGEILECALCGKELSHSDNSDYEWRTHEY